MNYSNEFWDSICNAGWVYFVIDTGNIFPIQPYLYVSDWN